SSAYPDSTPAPASTMISRPSADNVATVSGVAATRRSPARLSRTIPTRIVVLSDGHQRTDTTAGFRCDDAPPPRKTHGFLDWSNLHRLPPTRFTALTLGVQGSGW